APAFNEEATIETSLRALLALHYPSLEVIVISDGSKDRTIQVLIDRFDLVPVKTIYEQRIKTKPVRSLYRSSTYPALVVVDKENGGKADALNVGLSFARGELVCAMDADTLIEADGLKRLSYEQGGPGKIAFVPDPVAWTEVPESAGVLGRQRDRWHRGLADVLWRHRRMMFNPRYGVTGLFVFPYYAFVELLAPVIEAVGLVSLVLGLILGVIDWNFALLFYLTAYGLGTA